MHNLCHYFDILISKKCMMCSIFKISNIRIFILNDNYSWLHLLSFNIFKKSDTIEHLCSDFINTSYLTDSYIIFTLKMESLSKNTIFGLKMIVKSGLEKIILKFLHALTIFLLNEFTS